MKQTEILTRATHVNGWEPAVYMSGMSQNFRLLHVSNLSVRNFRISLLMYTGSLTARSSAAAGRRGPGQGDGGGLGDHGTGFGDHGIKATKETWDRDWGIAAVYISSGIDGDAEGGPGIFPSEGILQRGLKYHPKRHHKVIGLRPCF